jgi:DNA-binding transcriptional regulator YiaG
LSAEELRAAMAGLGLNRRETAAALEVDEATVGRWLAGTRAIPGPVRVALRCMAALQSRGRNRKQ